MYYQLKKQISKLLILAIIAGIAFSCKPKQNDLELTRFLIDSIQSQFIPDSRVEAFALKATNLSDRILLTGKTTNLEALAKLEYHLKLQNIVFADSIVRLPDTTLLGKTWGLITLSVANLRYTPAHSAEMATQALMGTPVRVLQEQNGWFLVQTPDNYIAWTEAAGIVTMLPDDMDQWKASDRVIYLADIGEIYSAPDQNALPVSDIVMGGILRIDQENNKVGSYVPVSLPDGRQGFVNKAESEDFRSWSQAVLPDTQAFIKVAFKMMGRPYLWGGTSVKAFDCSGFTKSIYLSGGLILSRDASQQVKQGTEVDGKSTWQNLKSGDLLFFGRIATGELSEKVSHVGMYIGGSEFIHCSGMVRVNSLDSTRTNFKPYYLTNLLHVKRIIGGETAPSSFYTHPWYQ